jgi:predicted  nucleic acid-binding Zn-ribbon protein
MPVTAQELKALHELHMLTRDTQAELERGPRQVAMRTRMTQQKVQEQEQRQQEHKDMKMSIDRKQLELRSLEAKLVNLQVKLNQISNQREYDAILKEIEADTAAKSVLEDEILELLDRIEGAAVAVVEAKGIVATALQEQKKVEQEVADSTKTLTIKLEELKAKLKASESIFPGEIAAHYRKIVESKGADCMAAIENGVCTGCYVSLTSQNLIKIKSGELLFCYQCTSLLYLA